MQVPIFSTHATSHKPLSLVAVDTAMEREIVRAAVVMGCSIRYMLQEHAEGVEQVISDMVIRFRCLAVGDRTLFLICIFVVVMMMGDVPSF